MGDLQERGLQKMFCHTPAVYVLGCLLQFLPQIPLVYGAVIPQSAGITATSSTLGLNAVECNDLEGWVGNGIIRSDCAAATSEFFSTSVQLHGTQDFEFLNREVHQISHLPSIVTPTKFYHGGYQAFSLGFGLPHLLMPLGTCVFIIVEMAYFGRTPLPGGQPRVYPKNDIATYVDVFNAAVDLSSQCVEENAIPQAGWSVTGEFVHK